MLDPTKGPANTDSTSKIPLIKSGLLSAIPFQLASEGLNHSGMIYLGFEVNNYYGVVGVAPNLCSNKEQTSPKLCDNSIIMFLYSAKHLNIKRYSQQTTICSQTMYMSLADHDAAKSLNVAPL